MPPKKSARNSGHSAKAGAKKAGAKKAGAKKAGTGTKVRVRMYRQGLGDCFLVSFFTDANPRHMLIDCGTLGATTTNVKLPEVIDDIRSVTGGHLDLLVATHEHRDHVSGFGGNTGFDVGFTIDRAWAAWTEDATDPFAKQIAKYKGDLLNSIRLAANALKANPATDPAERKALDNLRTGMRGLLSFFADLPADDTPLAADLAKTVNQAMNYVTTKVRKQGRFLMPGKVIEPADGFPGVRFYVLGPPRNESQLRNMGEHGSPELYSLTSQFSRDLASCATFSLAGTAFPAYRKKLDPAARQVFEARLPFDPRFRVEGTESAKLKRKFPSYFKRDEAWRRIDGDWLTGGSELALQLDSYTNNTSLALAIELVDDGRVLLFPADAQLGNWQSWHGYTFKVKDGQQTRDVKAAELLRRTVFYKVGHHSSHNATARGEGLELMEREELVAMIPVDEAVALKKRPPWVMPAKALYKRLLEKTKGRVVRSDRGWPSGTLRPSTISADAWQQARKNAGVTENRLYFDYELK